MKVKLSLSVTEISLLLKIIAQSESAQNLRVCLSKTSKGEELKQRLRFFDVKKLDSLEEAEEFTKYQTLCDNPFSVRK